MRVAAYLRQSQDRSGNEYGVERQREQVERLVEVRGWTIVATYVDNDVSATSRKPRPQFEAMMAAVERGEIDVISSRHMDRLLRRLADLERVFELCEAHGTYIVTAADGIDTSTPGGKMNARILGSVAQGEVERKAERQRDAAIQAAKAGRWAGGRRAFGYEADGVTLRPDEAVVIRAGYDAVLAGEPMTVIARSWNEAGFSTTQMTRGRQPGTWTRSGARDVLLNPRNAGLRRHRPEGDQGAFRKDPTAFIVGKAQWPAIIDEDTYRAAVRVLVAPERRRAPVNAKALLTGVARCHCGSTVHAGGARRQYRVYRCKASPGHIQRMAEPIEKWVEDVIVERLSRPDALARFAPTVEADTGDLAREADVLRQRLEGLAEDYADGTMTREQFRDVNKKVIDKLAVVESEMAAVGAADLIAPVVSSDDVAATWEALSTARRRAIIDTLVTVTIHTVGRGVRTFRPESVEVTWHIASQ